MSLLQGLPKEIRNKINKTKQTRGAQPYGRVPWQNRVNRTGIAVVPYNFQGQLPQEGFENGYVILVRPGDYFSASGVRREDFDPEVEIGRNAFVYYDNRRDWFAFPPLEDWSPRFGRPGEGHYLTRVPATTAAGDEGEAVIEGDPQGIRFFEYASSQHVENTVAQLAWLAWHTVGIDDERTDEHHHIPADLEEYLQTHRLNEVEKFVDAGVLAVDHETTRSTTICPLCREPISARGLMTRLAQVEGREVSDLTVTEINLFHLKDLRPGEYNHQPYLLAWGHHYCNIVARDVGISETLNWMTKVLENHGRKISN